MNLNLNINIKLLLAVAAVGLAIGYFANGTLVGSKMALRTISMACNVLDAAEQAGQLTSAQSQVIFDVVMKAIDKDRLAPVEPSRARRCQSSS